MIYSSNAAKRRRQLPKTHGRFPNDEAALKFLYLASAIVGPSLAAAERRTAIGQLPSCSATAASALKLQSE
jgi:hypothetical protein